MGVSVLLRLFISSNEVYKIVYKIAFGNKELTKD